MSSSSQGCGSDPRQDCRAANQEAPPSAAQSEFQCAVSADAVRRALCVVSDNETRYYLSGVFVTAAEGGGAYVVGTDGAALVCIRDPSASVTGSGILKPNEATRAALKSDRWEKRPRLVFARRDRLVVAPVSYDSADEVLSRPNSHCVAVQFYEPTITGAYPDWRKVMREPKPDGRLPCLDARLVKRIGRALAPHSDERRAPITLIPTGTADHEPVWVLGRYPNGVGVIAGLRESERAGTLPAWISAAVPELTQETPTPSDEAQASGLAAGSLDAERPTEPREAK